MPRPISSFFPTTSCFQNWLSFSRISPLDVFQQTLTKSFKTQVIWFSTTQQHQQLDLPLLSHRFSHITFLFGAGSLLFFVPLFSMLQVPRLSRLKSYVFPGAETCWERFCLAYAVRSSICNRIQFVEIALNSTRIIIFVIYFMLKNYWSAAPCPHP